MIEEVSADETDQLPQPRRAALSCDVRQSVLGAVAKELGVQRRRRRWENGIGLTATILLAAGIAANIALPGFFDDRLKQFSGPSLYERRVHAFVESLEWVANADALEAWLLACRPGASRNAPMDRDRPDLQTLDGAEPLVSPANAG